MKKKKLTVSDIDLSGDQSKVTPTPTVDATSKSKKPKVNLKSLLKNRKFQLFSLISLVGIGAVVWIFYTIVVYRPANTAALLQLNENYLRLQNPDTQNYRSYNLADPSEPRTKINPLNGELLTLSQFEEMNRNRPVAVMINNHYAARPLSNTSRADIMYETLVESGITRMMGIYWSEPVSKVGPIRSARQPYLELLSEYDAIYIHDGYASSDDPRIDAGGNIARYQIKAIATQGAWREPSRVAPHNEYSSVANAFNIGRSRDWIGLPAGFTPWNFKNDAPKQERGSTVRADVIFHNRLRNNGLYDVRWSYDRDTNLYMRSIGGTPDIDLENNQQLGAKTVIIQETDIIPSGDEQAHIITAIQGSGDATILQDGKVIRGSWKKQSRTGRTKYFDENNQEIRLNRGLIWIQIVSESDSSSDIIEQ